ncbi:MAG: SbcC/MukB-like Walker B domain-containing protein [Bacteroidales bacterium]|nr:SbcC/MukB-like Walker B domain-containing protein [Bacteroidales bacterium]
MRVLAVKANQHLARISGRYEVFLTHEMKRLQELNFDIVDMYQGDHIRPMNTLSGGETFLVSLALALGLSDMASGSNPVESLFVDEGFGALDPQTLEMALSALENLQSTGKTIGIISHVELLKERIPCQIQLIKKGAGVSEIVVK